MKISALYIYPFKGGPAFPVNQWQAEERGLQHDRRFMVTNAAGKFLTQRSHPALGRCSIELTNRGLLVSADGIGSIVLRPPGTTDKVDVQVWSDTVHATRTAATSDDFFTELVGEPAMLVYMGDDAQRTVGSHPEHPLSFADGYPYLVANTASLDSLNKRIAGDPVPMLAFRPSIVVESTQPWAEDSWNVLDFGDAALECTTNCERCSVTTLDPTHPDRPRRDGEPLRTLAKFRRNASGKVDFARNAILARAGMLAVGDVVTPM